MAYATVEDLALIWRDLSEDEKGRAAVLLDAAAVLLDAELKRCHVRPEDVTEALRYVSCQMVRRVLVSGTDAGDNTSVTRTAGSFTEMLVQANPSGDMYLTSNERRLLGVQLRRGRIAQVGMA